MMQFNTNYNPYTFNTAYSRPSQFNYSHPAIHYNNPSVNHYGSYSSNSWSPVVLITALVGALFGHSGASNNYWNTGYNNNQNHYYSGNYGNNNHYGNHSNHSGAFGNQDPVQDYLGQFGYDRNITNPLVSYNDAETGVGAGTYDKEKTAYNIYDPTGDTSEVYVLNGENSQYMIRNDKGANAFDLRQGDYKEVKLEDLGSDDIIVVSDVDQLKLKKHVKTAYGWEFHVQDKATDSLITIHTRDQDQINNQSGNWETVSRDWDYVKERLVSDIPADF